MRTIETRRTAILSPYHVTDARLWSEILSRRAPKIAATVPGRFVAYLRVSTNDQALGIEAQRIAIERHVSASGGELLTEFVEHASGADDNRPQLTAALAMCRETGSTLIVSRLDRLSRRVSFIARLIDERAPIVACDYPSAPTLQLHIVAAFAQDEREKIARRTSEALQALKARGRVLGGGALTRSRERVTDAASRVRTVAATERAWQAFPAIAEARAAGCENVAKIAARLSAHPEAIKRTLARTVGSLFAA